MPTAASQYAIQKALDNPIAFATSDMHNRNKFIDTVGIELDGHERMGNYEPIPIDKVPKGTKLIDMVWSM